jgi:hypothetical protein
MKLRALLAEYRRTVEDISGLAGRDEATLLEVVAPFLSRNASLLQISNEAYSNGEPGDGAGADLAAVVPLGAINDHAPLLNNPEFAGVVTRKMWTDIRVRDEVCNDMTKDIDEIVRLIDQEMEMMS